MDTFMLIWCWPLCTTIVALAATWRWPALKYRAAVLVLCAVALVGWFYIGMPIATHGGCVVPMWWCLVLALISLVSYVTLATLLTGIAQTRRQQKKETANQASHATSEPAQGAGSSSREG